MEIQRDQKGGKFSLTQKWYLKKILQMFNINGDTKSICTLLAPHFKLKATISLTTTVEREYITHVPYASMVGSLMYVIVCTSPDLSQTVSWLADTSMILVGVIDRQ